MSRNSSKRHAVERSEKHGAKRHAQATILDFVVAFIIFITVFLINYCSWNSIQIKIANTEDRYYFETSVYNAVEALLKTNGEPINWEQDPSNAVSIGLVTKDNLLSNEKLAALNSTAYDLLRDKVLSTADYEITISNGLEVYKTGKRPLGEIIRVDRLVKINGTTYTFTFKGWINE